ncbi:syntaxin, Qa-SNARE family, putative [Plasmodium gallinaceum]|uniref:Syntaxin, Qa-SNARE family, putative n=1 Tax=Plasmodium gallinaceum TaxID=5849 RepID=A0A1J1GTU4_PLAGA|nr:syntaxin, Qa-SNARE family, putative [Plasmodium gallinaceum]CRG95906.1 syntaxin, Qa-SNARE family, putative [Plasmodium gallinaceum]
MSYKNYESGHISNIEEKADDHEKKIKDNILLIKKNMIYAEENLENLKNNLISKRIIEALHEEIQQIYVKVVETESLFREWEIKFAGNPFEKQKKKYIFEKLNIHFKNEVNKLENISVNVKKAANELPNIENGEMNYNNINNPLKKKKSNKFVSSDFANDNFILNVDKSYVNNDDFIESSNAFDYELDQFSENDFLIENEIAKERFEGIKKIQGQVAQAQEVFKDLANLVFTQKENIEILNNNVYETSINTFNSAKELKKTYHNVKQQKFSWFLAVVTLLIFIYFIYFKLLHFSFFT